MNSISASQPHKSQFLLIACHRKDNVPFYSRNYRSRSKTQKQVREILNRYNAWNPNIQISMAKFDGKRREKVINFDERFERFL